MQDKGIDTLTYLILENEIDDFLIYQSYFTYIVTFQTYIYFHVTDDSLRFRSSFTSFLRQKGKFLIII